MNYPNDWFCKCGHVFEQHGFASHNKVPDACLVLMTGEINTNPSNDNPYIDMCGHFKPVDNLTYVELKAKEVLK